MREHRVRTSIETVTGFITLTRREILRFLRRPRNTFVPPFVTNVLYFSVFGVILGSRVGKMDFSGHSVDYIVFILPGLVVLGAISNAFENSCFSIFHGRWNRYIEETLTSPMSYSRMVASYIVSGATRGLLVGALVAVLGAFFTSVGVARPFYLVAFGLVITLLFSSFGVVGGLWADDWDNLTMMNQFIVRPLVFFGGVFYTLDSLHSDLFRPSPCSIRWSTWSMASATASSAHRSSTPTSRLGVLTALTVVVMAIDAYLFRRGYGLTE